MGHTDTRIVFSIWEIVVFVCGCIIMGIISYYSRLIENEGDKKKVIDDLILVVGLFIVIIFINFFATLWLIL